MLSSLRSPCSSGPRSSLGWATESFACQSVLHCIHRLRRGFLHLPHYLIQHPFSLEAVVIREHTHRPIEATLIRASFIARRVSENGAIVIALSDGPPLRS